MEVEVWFKCLVLLNLLNFCLLYPNEQCRLQYHPTNSACRFSKNSSLMRRLYPRSAFSGGICPNRPQPNNRGPTYSKMFLEAKNCPPWRSCPENLVGRRRANVIGSNPESSSDNNINQNLNTNINLNTIPLLQQISPEILTELYNFIKSVSSKQLISLSPALNTFIATYPQLPTVIKYIFEHYDLTNDELMPEYVISLLNILKSRKMVLNDRKFGQIIPRGYIIDWVHQNDYLVVPQNIQSVIMNFMYGIINHRLVDVSVDDLHLILNYPDLEMFLQGVLNSFNIQEVQNAQQIIALLEIIRDIKLHRTIQEVPVPIISVITGLNGALDLSNYILDIVQQSEPNKILDIVLEVMKIRGRIPDNLRAWILTLPDGAQILEFLAKPGVIICDTDLKGVYVCTKNIPQVKILSQFELELRNFILNLNNHKLVSSPNLIQYILEYSISRQFITSIYEKYNIPASEFTPDYVFLLLDILKNNWLNKTVQDIPADLLPLLLTLQETNESVELIFYIFNSILQMPQIDIFQILRQVSINNTVPHILLPWIMSLPKSQLIIQYLIHPDQVICKQNPVNKSIVCSEGEQDLKIEIKSFIEGLRQFKLNEVSHDLIEAIKNPADFLELIQDIFGEYQIPYTDIDPNTVVLFLQTIKDTKLNNPIKYAPFKVLGMLLQMVETQQTRQLINFILNSMLHDPKVDMLLILRILNESGREIPVTLLYWILSLPAGPQIIQHLQNPEKVACKQIKDTITCEDLMGDIKNELKVFINNLIHNKLIELSVKFLRFIETNSLQKIQAIIELVLEDYPQVKIDPKKIVLLLKIMRDEQMGVPVLEAPLWLVNFLTNLERSETGKNILYYILNSMIKNPQMDILQIIQTIIKNKGNKIPQILLEWISSQPNGQQIIYHLEHPDQMECFQEVGQNVIICKNSSDNVKTQLKVFIEGVIHNKYIELTPEVLEFITNQQELQKLVLLIYQENGIPKTVPPDEIIKLLTIIRHINQGTPLPEVSPSLIKLLIKLQGAQNITYHILDSMKQQHQINLLNHLQQIVVHNRHTIPETLKNWLLLQPNSQQIIVYLLHPDQMKCFQQEGTNEIVCLKLVDTVKNNLKEFIEGVIHNKYIELSPEVLEFITKQQELKKLVLLIYQENGIPKTVPPERIIELLTIIRHINQGTLLPKVSSSLIELLIKLQGAQNITYHILDSMKQQHQINLLNHLQQIVVHNRHTIPEILNNWLSRQPNSQQIIVYLLHPDQMKCFQQEGTNEIVCLKSVDTVKNNLKVFIESVIQNKYIELTPEVLEFITKQQELQKLVLLIYQENGIPKTVPPEQIIKLLVIIRHINKETPLPEVSLSLIKLLIKLQGAQNITYRILESMKQQHPIDFLDYIRQIIIHNGNIIPGTLNKWLLLLPKGQQIIKYLLNPAEMYCSQLNNGKIDCIDTLLQAKSEINIFIQGLLAGTLPKVSGNLVSFISYYPDLEVLIKNIFKDNGFKQDKINVKTVLTILNLLKDNKTHRFPINIPTDVITLILQLEGGAELSKFVLNWVQSTSSLDPIQLILFIMKDSAGKIPENVLKWVEKLPNSKKILEFIKSPGKIVCEGGKGKIVCNKQLKADILINLPLNITIELEEYIKGVENNIYGEISQNLLYFIVKHPAVELHKIIELILAKNTNITTISQKKIETILNIIKHMKTNTPMKNIPQSVIKMIIKSSGSQIMTNYVLNWARQQHPDILSYLLKILRGLKEIPANLRDWIVTLPNGRGLLVYLSKPGRIQCKKHKCIKIFPSDDSGSVPQNIKRELQKIILGLVQNKLEALSPAFQEFLIKHSIIGLRPIIELILREQNITKIDAHTINQLLQVIKGQKMGKPSLHPSKLIINIIINLKGGYGLSEYVLGGLQQTQQDLISFLLGIIKNDTKIPSNLEKWVKTLPNGPQILEYLQMPGNIECDRQMFCSKTVQTLKIPPNIHQELLTFIIDLTHEKLDNMSADLLKFIENHPHPEIQSIIEHIFISNYISQTVVTPERVTKILIILKDKKMNKPLKNTPRSIIDLLIKLLRGPDMGKYIFEWIKNYGMMELMQIFLEAFYEIDSVEIPANFREWVVKLPWGAGILNYLSSPGKIQCIFLSENKKTCKKEVQSNSTENSPKTVIKEINMFINHLQDNKFIEPSQELLNFIGEHPIAQLQYIIEQIFENNNIVQVNVTPFQVAALLQIIRNKETKTPLNQIPKSVLTLVMTLKNASELNNYILNWIKENLDVDMLQLFLGIIKDYKLGDIPPNLREWILKQQNGREILLYLLQKDTVDCKQPSRRKIVCQKYINIEEPKDVPKTVITDLEKFIFHITENKYQNPSTALLEFIQKTSKKKLEQTIEYIFELNDIPQSEINTDKIATLLYIIQNQKANKIVDNIPNYISNLILRLEGAQDLSTYVLNWVTQSQKVDMLQLFLEAVKDNGGTVIPLNLRQWLLSLSQGQKIIQYLELPGQIDCERHGDKLKCVKLVYENQLNKETINNILRRNKNLNLNQNTNNNSN